MAGRIAASVAAALFAAIGLWAALTLLAFSDPGGGLRDEVEGLMALSLVLFLAALAGGIALVWRGRILLGLALAPGAFGLVLLGAELLLF